MNEKLRARMAQIEEQAVDNMANGLQATRITDGDKGVRPSISWEDLRRFLTR
jgi:hypothetical protein